MTANTIHRRRYYAELAELIRKGALDEMLPAKMYPDGLYPMKAIRGRKTIRNAIARAADFASTTLDPLDLTDPSSLAYKIEYRNKQIPLRSRLAASILGPRLASVLKLGNENSAVIPPRAGEYAVRWMQFATRTGLIGTPAATARM